MPKKIRVGIIEDHPLMLDGICRTLQNSDGLIEVVATGSTGADALSIARREAPDILLLDVSIPGGGIEAAYAIGTECPSLKVIMLTVSERPSHVTASLEAGAKGYLLKGIAGAELIHAIASVNQGHTYIAPEFAGQLLSHNHAHANSPEKTEPLRTLTRREQTIAEALAHGKTNKEIAELLNLTEKTIKHYMTNIFQKLQVRNRVEAVLAMRKT
jgi:two-component system, NarL family, nitrate/nitrite response regulator NarL